MKKTTKVLALLTAAIDLYLIVWLSFLMGDPLLVPHFPFWRRVLDFAIINLFLIPCVVIEEKRR